MKNQYDIVIVGGGVTGLTAAALLAGLGVPGLVQGDAGRDQASADRGGERGQERRPDRAGQEQAEQQTDLDRREGTQSV